MVVQKHPLSWVHSVILMLEPVRVGWHTEFLGEKFEKKKLYQTRMGSGV